LLPMGKVSSTITASGLTSSATAMGFGDPMLQFGINVVGPKAIKSIPDFLRYKPGFSLDIIASLAIPVGNYDHESPVNIGQNRWYGRIGLPVVWQIGKWVPGKQTTIEVLPALWLFGDNKDFMGQKSETTPLLQTEGHVTRDFMEKLWGSVNIIWYYGAKTTISSSDTTTHTPELNNIGLGGTLGYVINDNLQLTLSYATTLHDKTAEDLKISTFRITLIFGWHRMIEGIRRLKSEG
jgi:hypothetical protein